MPLLGRRKTTPAADFETRLAMSGPNMDARLAEAHSRHSIDSHTAETVVDYADTVRLTPASASKTPVADLFQRAQQRIQRDGWSRDTARNGRGGVCLSEAIQAETGNSRDEQEARIILRELGGGANLPEFNRSLKSAGHATQILGRAAQIAADRRL